MYISLLIHCKNNHANYNTTNFIVPLNLLQCHLEHNLYRKASSFCGVVNMEPHQLEKFPAIKSK